MQTRAMRLSRRGFIGGAGALASAQLLAACQSTAAEGPRGYPQLQALMDRYVAEGKLSGAMIAVKKDRELVRYLSAGRIAMAPDAPVSDENSLYRVYSMTKPITAVAAMQLVDRGKLTLDQPISELIPEFRQMRVVNGPDTLDSHPAQNPIRVRHLMTHTAGLSYNISGDAPLAKLYRERGVTPIGRLSQTEPGQPPLPPTLDEFGAIVAGLPLAREPGTAYEYSISLDVLGLVIQRASGQPYEAYLKEHLFEPLDMHDADFWVPAEKLPRLTTLYARDPETRALRAVDGPPQTPYANPHGMPCGGAGLVTSTRDYIRFCEMLLNEGALGGQRVMSRAAARLCGANIMPEGVLMNPTSGYGAGMRVALGDTDADGLSRGAYGWGGAASTNMWVDPLNRAAVVFMTQYIGRGYDLDSELPHAAKADFAA